MKEKEKYLYTYPSVMSADRRMWVLEEGDQLKKDGVLYDIVQIVKPKIVGSRPKIVLSEVKNEAEAP